MFVDGIPSGYGIVVDQHTNHYEGTVTYDVKAGANSGTILGNGRGTLYQEAKVIKGTFGKGVLTVPDNKEQATTALICTFPQPFDLLSKIDTNKE